MNAEEKFGDYSRFLVVLREAMGKSSLSHGDWDFELRGSRLMGLRDDYGVDDPTPVATDAVLLQVHRQRNYP